MIQLPSVQCRTKGMFAAPFPRPTFFLGFTVNGREVSLGNVWNCGSDIPKIKQKKKAFPSRGSVRDTPQAGQESLSEP